MSFLRWWQDFWHDDSEPGETSNEYDEQDIINSAERIANEPDEYTDQSPSSRFPGLFSWFFGSPDEDNGK